MSLMARTCDCYYRPCAAGHSQAGFCPDPGALRDVTRADLLIPTAPFIDLCPGAQVREVIEVTASRSLAKKFQAVRQASTMCS